MVTCLEKYVVKTPVGKTKMRNIAVELIIENSDADGNQTI